MSKTVEIQIEKSRILLTGLKQHLKESGGTEISVNELKSTEESLNELESLSSDIDRLREELNPKVKDANHKLAVIKRIYSEQKKIIKSRYPMERWADYGVPDKR